MGSIRQLWAAVAVVCAVAAPVPALADEWPSRPILVLSPFAVGTTCDLVAHTALDPAAAQIGQPFTIENRPGGGGTVAVLSAVKAAPDGYTFLLATSAMTMAAILHKSLPYDVAHDLAPVAMFGGEPSMLLAAPGRGYNRLDDLVSVAKATPEKVKFGSLGVGSAAYIAGQRFSQLAGLAATHVGYSAPSEALENLAAGRIDFYFVPVSPALPLIAQGKAVPLGVSAPHRLQSLPGLPTLRESGYPVPPYLTWCGLAAPANTPAAIVSKINTIVGKVLDLPAVRTKMLRTGYLPEPMSADQFGQFVSDDLAAMIRLGKEAHIEPVD
jgi:tripartite-type tricarboxylate transporter receptor subunit TctC